MLDYQSIYAVGMARRDDMLRQAAAEMLASEVPSGPSPLRGAVSRWLYALADWLEPTRNASLATRPARLQAP